MRAEGCNIIRTGRQQNLPTLILFSPREPHFLLTGENARASAESGRALSPVIKNNVATPREESSDEFTS